MSNGKLIINYFLILVDTPIIFCKAKESVPQISDIDIYVY